MRDRSILIVMPGARGEMRSARHAHQFPSVPMRFTAGTGRPSERNHSVLQFRKKGLLLPGYGTTPCAQDSKNRGERGRPPVDSTRRAPRRLICLMTTYSATHYLRRTGATSGEEAFLNHELKRRCRGNEIDDVRGEPHRPAKGV